MAKKKGKKLIIHPKGATPKEMAEAAFAALTEDDKGDMGGKNEQK